MENMGIENQHGALHPMDLFMETQGPSSKNGSKLKTTEAAPRLWLHQPISISISLQ
jgi:hypothetical protein